MTHAAITLYSLVFIAWLNLQKYQVFLNQVLLILYTPSIEFAKRLHTFFKV